MQIGFDNLLFDAQPEFLTHSLVIFVVFLFQAQFFMTSFVKVSTQNEKPPFHITTRHRESYFIIMQCMEQSISA